MSDEGAGLRRAAALGTVTGARTFLAPAALALRGRLGKAARFVVPALAAGELVGDKLPSAPPRSAGPGLVGRVVSGAFTGRVTGGARGLRVGATFALASTYPSQVLRAQIVARTPVPDIAYAVPEDLIATIVAFFASTEPRPDLADQREDRHGIVTGAALGLAAGVVGVAAMATAQNWLVGLAGGEESIDPADLVGKAALGLPFGVLTTRGGRAPNPIDGIGLGLAACALDLAPIHGRRPRDPIGRHLALGLVYGVSTSAALEALTA